jgi:LysM repeat protein
MTPRNSRWLLVILTLLVTLVLATAVAANTIHTVQRGETLFSIARRYNTTVTAIMQANNLVNPNTIFAGQQLIIPPMPPANPLPPANPIHVVSRGETLASIARLYGVTVNELARANNISNPNHIFVGQQLIIPTAGAPLPPAPTPTPMPPANPIPPATITHVVRPGETMSSIARLYGVSVTDIARVNNITNPNLIFVGQRLIIPGAGAGTTPPNPTPMPPANPIPPANPTPPPSGGMTTYVVQPGDTLNRIAMRFGVTVTAIMQANNITNPNIIFVGQVLNIPTSGGTTPPPGTNPPPPPSGSLPQGFLFGGQTQTLANPSQMNHAGMRWVKFQYKWRPGDSATAVAGLIQAGRNQNYKVLLSITGANVYPPANGIDFPAFTNFLRDVASLNPPPDAIEIWNEMNIDFEWPAGQISPNSYVQNMLAPGYNAIKAANPNIFVISGAPAPTGFDNGTNAWADDRYMRGMAAAGAARYMDCIGIHYNAGATSPSARSGHPGGSHYSWYFFPMIEVYSGAFGGARPLCFTELGYLTGEGFGALPPNFAWASNTTLANHAAWLAEATRLSMNDSRVRMLIIFNVDFTLFQPNGDPQAGYAMIRPGGGCPSCDTIRAVTGGR